MFRIWLLKNQGCNANTLSACLPDFQGQSNASTSLVGGDSFSSTRGVHSSQPILRSPCQPPWPPDFSVTLHALIAFPMATRCAYFDCDFMRLPTLRFPIISSWRKETQGKRGKDLPGAVCLFFWEISSAGAQQRPKVVPLDYHFWKLELPSFLRWWRWLIFALGCVRRRNLGSLSMRSKLCLYTLYSNEIVIGSWKFHSSLTYYSNMK